MLGTLPYPTLTPNPTPNPPLPAQNHLTQPQPLHLSYPTAPPPTHTQPLPYSCPAIHCLSLPYHTLPYPSLYM